MEYVVAVVSLAIVIGLLLSAAVYYLLGADIGYFFAKFIAGPAEFLCSLVLFIVYDHLWPKRQGGSGK